MLRIFSILCQISIVCICSAKSDKTYEWNGSGVKIVDEVIKKINASGLFEYDYDMMRRISYVESRFGDNLTMINGNNKGGIWQVDDLMFNTINKNWEQHFSLKVIIMQVRNYFGIDFREVDRKDLLKPIYSGLAARIWIHITEQNIPNDIDEQANLWKKFYDRGRSDISAKDFSKIVSQYENGILKTCGGRMDLALVMDASGSIGSENYEKAKDFVIELVGKFNLNTSKIGLVIFSDWAEIIFDLKSDLNLEEISEKIESSPYPGDYTHAEYGIEAAVNILFNVTTRVGVPKIMIIFSDGHPNGNEQRLQQALEDARHKEVTIFAFGIGDFINNETLLNFSNSPERFFSKGSYDLLSTAADEINRLPCTVPQKNLPSEFTITDQLNKLEPRFFDMKIEPDGLMVKVDTNRWTDQDFLLFY